jgi:hypothetical protein
MKGVLDRGRWLLDCQDAGSKARKHEIDFFSSTERRRLFFMAKGSDCSSLRDEGHEARTFRTPVRL